MRRLPRKHAAVTLTSRFQKGKIIPTVIRFETTAIQTKLYVGPQVASPFASGP